MIFCALSNHATKVRQAHAAVIRFNTLQYVSIRFSTFPYDSVRFHTISYDFTCCSAARASSRFAQVIHDEPYLAWGDSLGGLAVAVATRSVISTLGMLSTRCVRPASWAPPHHRAVGSYGWGLFRQSWQFVLSCAAYLPPDCPSCRIFPSIFGRDARIRLHLRAIPGERKVLKRWTGACLLRLLRAKTAYISCLSPDFTCLEGWICWCCTSYQSCL